MNIEKLAPWNWFKKEQEDRSLPVSRRESSPAAYPSPMLQIHQEIDRMFEDAFRNWGGPLFGAGREGSLAAPAKWLKPNLDIHATDKDYTVSVELPGVEEKDVHLELSGDTLVIKGEKKQEKEEKQKNFYRMERSYGAFQRTLSLPEDADQDEISAAFKKGVVTITIPRKAHVQSETKRIEIQKG